MHKKQARAVVFLAFEVVAVVAFFIVLVPLKWPKTGELRLLVSFGDSGQQMRNPKSVMVSGKNGFGQSFGPKIVPFRSPVSIDGIGEGTWNISISAVDAEGTTIASSSDLLVRVRHEKTEQIPVILDPIWTGNYSLSVRWPASLGEFTLATLSWDSDTRSVIPVVTDDRCEAMFTVHGLPAGPHVFDFLLSGGKGGEVRIPHVDSFTVSGSSRSHDAVVDLSDFGILSDATVVASLRPVSLSAEHDRLVFSSPDNGVAISYRLSCDGAPFPEKWTEGREAPLPVASSFLAVEAKAVMGDVSSSVSTAHYDVASVPTFSLTSGTYHEVSSLSLDGDGTMVSVDGGEFVPYEGQLSIDHDGMTVRAYGIGDGLLPSPVITGTYRLTTSSPVLSLDDGVVTMACPTKDAVIHYTFGGPEITYTAPVSVSSSGVFTAYASHAGMADSPLVTFAVQRQEVPSPSIALENGEVRFVVSDPSASVSYRYAIWSGEFSPWKEGLVFPVEAGSPVRVEAFATKTGCLRSSVASAWFLVAPQPVFLPIDERTEEPVSLVFHGKGACFFSLDGQPYQKWTGPVTLQRNTKVTVWTRLPGYVDSYPVTQVYHVQVAKPCISVSTNEDGTKEVSVSTSTDGAVITCTVDGASFTYTGPFALSHSASVVARASKEQMDASSEATLPVTVEETATPTLSFSDGVVIVSCPDPDAVAFHRLDGDGEFVEGGNIPVQNGRPLSIEAYAKAPGKIRSPMASGLFSVSAVTVETVSEKEEPAPSPMVEKQVLPVVPVWNVKGTGPAGGIVFYDKGFYSDGWRYLEAAPSDEQNLCEWGQYASGEGRHDVGIGAGRSNTESLVGSEENGDTEGAAWVCASKVVVSDGVAYDDWFLPSRDELEVLLKLRDSIELSKSWYWSSSEVSPELAWEGDARSGGTCPYYKSSLHAVRAVRAF